MMDTHPQLSMLAARIVRARDHADWERGPGEKDEMAEFVLSSLRLTYAAYLSGLDPRDLSPGTFVLETRSPREHLVRHLGRPVPVNGAYLSRVLADQDLDLAPGEILFLDPRLVADLVEQALGQIAHEELVIRKLKAELEEIARCAGGHSMESLKSALGSTEEMAVKVRSRKVDLIATSLAASDVMEKMPPSGLPASKEPPALAA
jgi:hypothetical protein